MIRKGLAWAMAAFLVLSLCLPAFAKRSSKKGGGKSSKKSSASSKSRRSSKSRKKGKSSKKRSAKSGGKRSKGASSKSANKSRKKSRTPRVRKRRGNQAKRIGSGVKDGSLTKDEAKKLAGQQKKIGQARKKAGEDGTVTLKERAKLQHMQNKTSRQIFKERHDDEGEMGPVPKDKTRDPGVNKRQKNQRRRIKQGLRTGQLTKGEAKTIIGKERDLAKLEKDLKEDGKLNKDERKQLHEELGSLSKLIYEEKHDDEKRPRIKPALKKKIESGEITGKEAKALARKMRHAYKIRRKLGSDKDLTDEQREKLEGKLENIMGDISEIKGGGDAPEGGDDAAE